MYLLILFVVLHVRGALYSNRPFAVREQKAFSPLRSHTSYHEVRSGLKLSPKSNLNDITLSLAQRLLARNAHHPIITIIQNVTTASTEDLLDVFCTSDSQSFQVSTHKS